MVKNEIYEFPWDELLHLVNGKDVNGLPLSASALSVDEVNEDKSGIVTLKNAIMSDGAVSLFLTGGCAVAEVRFQRKDKMEYETARILAEGWLSGLDKPDYDRQMLTMTVSPLLMEGKLFLVLNDLTYAAGFEVPGGYALILGFDNHRTVPVVSDEIDIKAMIKEVDAEFTWQAKELDKDVIVVEEEENPYEKSLFEKISTVNFDKDDSDTTAMEDHRNPGMRIVKDEEDYS